MTFEAFTKQFKRSSAYDKYSSLLFAIAFIAFSLYVLVALLTNRFLQFPDGKWTGITLALLFLCLGVSALFVQKSRYKITIWENAMTEEENVERLKLMLTYLGESEKLLNENYSFILYRTGFWSGRMSFNIHMFAGSRFIAINIRNMQGLGYDVGRAKRLMDSLEIYSYDIKNERINSE